MNKVWPILSVLIITQAVAELTALTPEDLDTISARAGITVGYNGDLTIDTAFIDSDGSSTFNIDTIITGSPAVAIDTAVVEGKTALVMAPEIDNASLGMAFQLGNSADIDTMIGSGAGVYDSDFINSNRNNLLGIVRIDNLTLQPGSRIVVQAR